MDLLSLFHHDRMRTVTAETALAAFLFFFDPFGITSHKTHFINKAIATFGQYSYHSLATEKIAVVLIEQSALDNWKVDWPLPYGRTAGLIHVLACAKATGVFFDYTASEQYNLSDGRDLLEDLVADSSQRGPNCPDGGRPPKIAVFFGKADNISTRLATALDHNHSSFWIDAGPDDGLYPAGLSNFPAQTLSIGQVTPAFGIARSTNLIEPHDAADAGAQCRVGDPQPKCWVNPIVLRWSGLINSKQRDVSRTDGCRGELSRFEMLSNILGLTHDKQYEPCPPILTLKAEDLYRDQSFIAANGNPASLIAKRFIFVGTRLAGLNDQVFSPIHGYLPGVYKHAMAMDNLISYGANYPTIPRPWLLGVIVVVIYIAIEAARELSRGTRNANWIIVGVTLLCLVCFVTAILLWQWPPSLVFAVFAYYGGSIFFMKIAAPSPAKEKTAQEEA
jgi:CHASE2 domain